MGVAFSHLTIHSATIDGGGAEQFIEAAHLVFRRVNWELIEEYNDGYKYQLTSNQLLTCRMVMYPDPAAPSTTVIIQFMNDAETISGVQHRVFMGDGREFFLIAGHCQMFLSLPEYSNDADSYGFAHSVAGGIPYVDPAELGSEVEGECALTGSNNQTTELWWSCADTNELTAGNANFRYSLTCQMDAWSGVRNGTAYHTMGGVADSLRIFPLRHPLAAQSPSGQYTAWVDDSPIYIDPLIGWSNGDGQPRVRGQLWDAYLATKDMPLDEEILTTESDVNSQSGFGLWRNFTHYKGSMAAGEPHSYNGSLWLLHRVMQDGEDSNYVY